MFIVKDIQIDAMRRIKLEQVIKRTFELLRDEFHEFDSLPDHSLQATIRRQIMLASVTFKIKSFDLLEDFVVLSLQKPVLMEQPLPGDLQRILTWPGMDQNDKMNELERLLNSKY